MYRQPRWPHRTVLAIELVLVHECLGCFLKSALLLTDTKPSGGRTAMSSLDITPLHPGASEKIILHLWTALPQCCISVSNLMLLIKKENRIKATIPACQWETHSVDLHVSHLVPSFIPCTGVSPAIDILYNTFCMNLIMSQVLVACDSVCSQCSRHTLI